MEAEAELVRQHQASVNTSDLGPSVPIVSPSSSGSFSTASSPEPERPSASPAQQFSPAPLLVSQRQGGPGPYMVRSEEELFQALVVLLRKAESPLDRAPQDMLQVSMSVAQAPQPTSLQMLEPMFDWESNP
jgi:hypothetical protein